MRRSEYIAKYFRGRLSIIDVMNLPLSYINGLYRIAEEEMRDEEARKAK